MKIRERTDQALETFAKAGLAGRRGPFLAPLELYPCPLELERHLRKGHPGSSVRFLDPETSSTALFLFLVLDICNVGQGVDIATPISHAIHWITHRALLSFTHWRNSVRRDHAIAGDAPSPTGSTCRHAQELVDTVTCDTH